VVDPRIACALVSYTTSLLIACTTAAPAPATKIARCIDGNGKVLETPTFVRPPGDAKGAHESPAADDVIPRCLKYNIKIVFPKGGPPPQPVTVHVCVDADGNLVSAPSLVESSGYPAVDLMALTAAKQGDYKTAMEGKKLSGCFNYRALTPPQDQPKPP
jgi:hypothetical protein